jgi:excisionase family DNA binding protein
MSEAEQAAAYAIALAKRRNVSEVTPDELLLGCLQAIAQFGIAQVGSWTLDLEELGIDWLEHPDRAGAKVAYSQAAVDLFDRAARIAKMDGGAMRVDHLLAAFAGEVDGLMGELKRKYEITSAAWRAAVAQLDGPPSERKDEDRGVAVIRDYLTPEEAAAALSIHVQTLRAYVRSGKLPALRLAGERAIRIRRADLDKVLEPLVPQA